MANLLRQNIGSPLTVTTGNSISNNSYANSADKLRINNTGGALFCDFTLTGVTFGAAPTTGALQLVAVDRDGSGNAGPTPASTMLGRVVGTFSPQPAASNASTGWIMTINGVRLAADTDYWLLNSATSQTLNSGATLSAQPWSPGTP